MEIHKFMEIKQHAPKYQWWKKKSQGKWGNTFGLNGKWRPNIQNIWDASEAGGKFIAVNAYVKKKDVLSWTNWPFTLRLLKKKSKLNPKQAEGRK